MMMPITPGMGMELAGVPALTPARKTTASMPSRTVVVKASRKMPVMASLEVACTACILKFSNSRCVLLMVL